jgi:hypothetical protein
MIQDKKKYIYKFPTIPSPVGFLGAVTRLW